jgi:hypothetical protein
MPDVPEKRPSLAEMARVAAQKSLRPPPADAAAPLLTPSAVRSLTPPPQSVRSVPPASPAMFPPSAPGAPAGSMRAGDSGMVHLNELTSSPAIEPEIIAAVPAASSSTAAIQVERPLSSRPAPKARRGTSWLLVAGIVVLTGAAAAGVAAHKGLTARGAAQRILAVFKPAPAAAPITPFQPNEEHPAPAVAQAPPTPAQPVAAQRPEQPASVGGNATPATAGKHPLAVAGHTAGKPEKTAAAQPKAAEVQAPTVPERPAAAPANPLANAMEKAAGSQLGGGSVPPPSTRVDTGPSDVPEIPPQGAILGAIGAKRQAAKACVRGLNDPSRATLVFASSGSVQSVSVSGGAAGTPAEACLKKVFTKVSVDPFRRATYTSSTTISP